MLIRWLVTSRGRSEPKLNFFTNLAQPERLRCKDIAVKHVKDSQNPADFLTKWVSADKFQTSLAYATNSTAFVP